MQAVSSPAFLSAVSRTDSTSGSSLLLGYQPATTYFTGFMDDICVYNRVLSEAEIRAVYDATK